MNELRNILCAVDFSPASAVALGQAIRIGTWSRSNVRAVHVVDTVVVVELESALSALQQDIRKGIVDDAWANWEEFVKGVPGTDGVPIDVVIQNRVRGIIDAAKERNADLLVIGAYGDKAPNLGVGSVASACVRRAPCRVLVVRESHKGPFRRVVACVDFSDTSRRALDEALRLAAQDSAALDVLHTFDPPWRTIHYRALAAPSDPAFREQYTRGLEGRVREFCKPFEHEMGYVKAKVVVMESAGHRSGISAYAQQVGADLIVLGARGSSNIRDFLIGSTAEKALRELHCSALVIRPVA